MNSKRFLIIFALIITGFIDLYSQEIPIGIEIGTGAGFNLYDSKTSKYFDNSFYWSAQFYMYVGNLFIGFGNNSPSSTNNDSLFIYKKMHYKNEKLLLNFSTIVLGYKIYLDRKRIFSIDPYFGLLKTYVQSNNRKSGYDSRIGYCLGFYITRNIKTKLKHFQPYFFFNNRINYSKLSEINSNLGNFYYNTEFGIAFDWGDLRNK